MWSRIPGYENFYEASDVGQIQSFHRPVPRLLAHCMGQNGYAHVTLCKPDTPNWRVAVHQLVMLTFVGPCPPGMEVCHGIGGPLDNSLTNLRYDTRSSNHRDRVADGNHYLANRTHCPAHHEYTEANTYRDPKGYRYCRTCAADARRRYTERKKLPNP